MESGKLLKKLDKFTVRFNFWQGKKIIERIIERALKFNDRVQWIKN